MRAASFPFYIDRKKIKHDDIQKKGGSELISSHYQTFLPAFEELGTLRRPKWPPYPYLHKK